MLRWGAVGLPGVYPRNLRIGVSLELRRTWFERLGGSLLKLVSSCLFWEPVDPVVADPVRQDNDKTNNIQIYTDIPYSSTQGEGTKLPNTHILSLSCRTGSPTTGSTGCRLLSFLLGRGGFIKSIFRDSPSRSEVLEVSPCLPPPQFR